MTDDPRRGWLSWIEIDAEALAQNIRSFRRRMRPGGQVPGRGQEQRLRPRSRADRANRGPQTAWTASASTRSPRPSSSPRSDWASRSSSSVTSAARRPARAVACGAEVTVYNLETLEALSAASAGREVRCHVKVETGVYRQGIFPEELDSFLDRLRSASGPRYSRASRPTSRTSRTRPTTPTPADSSRSSPRRPRACALARPGAIRHCACTAAVLTMPETAFDMVRVGIGLYGLWPSKETLLSCLLEGDGGNAAAPGPHVEGADRAGEDGPDRRLHRLRLHAPHDAPDPRRGPSGRLRGRIRPPALGDRPRPRRAAAAPRCSAASA